MEDDLSYEALVRKGGFTPAALALGQANLRKILKDVEFQSLVQPKQFKQWVCGLTDATGRILIGTDAHFSDYSNFWLMLFELIKTGKEYFRRSFKLLDYVDQSKLTPEYKVVLEKKRCQADIIDAICQQFDEDEQIYIEYKRNCSAHMFQTGYSLKLGKEGVLIESYKGVAIEKVMEIAERQLKKFGNEAAATIHFAKRIKDDIERLLTLC